MAAGLVSTTAAAAAALVAVWWLVVRRSRQRERREAAALERRVRASFPHPTSPCPLDVCPATILNYPCGYFSLIEADLRVAITPAPRAEAALAALRLSGGLAAAFDVRRELISLKKACLALFHDTQRLERALHRQVMFFFVHSPTRAAFHLDPRWQHYSAVAEALERARTARAALHEVRPCAVLPPPLPPSQCSPPPLLATPLRLRPTLVAKFRP
jgi:hypothetical protein